jgi:DNA-binding IclR family transcriptional regulator
MNTADRLLAVLGLFAPERPDWTVEAAAKEIGVSVSTAYRYFRSLCKIGLLDPFAEGHYVLGPAIIEYDRQIRMLDPLIKIGRPIMQRMIAQTGSMGIALLCRVYRNRIMCVHQEANVLAENTVSFERGRPMPMFRGTGKVIFAHFPPRTAKSYFDKYKDEIAAAGLGADWETVKRNLRNIRKEGVLIARGEVDSDRVGIGTAIFGANGLPIGNITMALPLGETTDQFIASVCTVVEAAGHEITAVLAEHFHKESSPETVLHS